MVKGMKHLPAFNLVLFLIRCFLIYTHTESQTVRSEVHIISSKKKENVSQSLPVGLSHPQLVICFGTGGAQRG